MEGYAYEVRIGRKAVRYIAPSPAGVVELMDATKGRHCELRDGGDDSRFVAVIEQMTALLKEMRTATCGE